MIDRNRQTRWRAFIVAWKNVCRLEIAAEAHLKIPNDDGTNVRGTRALGARLLLLTGSRLGARRRAITLTHVNGCISDQISANQQRCQQRQDAQKSGSMQRQHRPNE